MNAPARIAAIIASSIVALGCGGGGGGGGDDGGSGDHGDAAACAHVALATAARNVALPSGYVAGAFPQVAASNPCGLPALPTYALLDVTGDGRADSVITHLCGDTSVGDTRWIVHPGGADGFGAATTWALPTGYLPGSFLQLAANPICGPAGAVTYGVLDLTGDHRPDLVITHLCGDTSVGDTRWIVHPGGASGFGAATTWALPTGYLPGSFLQLAANPICGPAGAVSYSLLDLTGDGRPDIVGTRLCGDTAVGNTRWIVHAAGDQGFAAASSWQLPTGYTPGAFLALTAEAACGPAGQPSFLTVDLDGDRRADLAVTQLCGDTTVGDTRWIVHRGQDGGFAVAASWSLPTGYVSGAFLRTSAQTACGPARAPSYVTSDVTGDGVADVIVTSLCGDTTVGDAHWLVHPGGAAGFAATPDDLALPTGYTTAAFRSIAASPVCGPAGAPTFVTTDLDGDARPDLVVTHLCGDTTVGDTRWLIHASACAP